MKSAVKEVRKILFRRGGELKEFLPNGYYAMLCSKYSGLSKNDAFFREREASNDLKYIRDVLNNGKTKKTRDPEIKKSLNNINCCVKNGILQSAKNDKGYVMQPYTFPNNPNKFYEQILDISNVIGKKKGIPSPNTNIQTFRLTAEETKNFSQINKEYGF